MHLAGLFGTFVLFVYATGMLTLMALAALKLFRRGPTRAYEDACCLAVLRVMAEAADDAYFSETDPRLVEPVYAIPIPRMTDEDWIRRSRGRLLEVVLDLLVMEESVLAVEAMPLEGGPPCYTYRITPSGRAWLASRSDA